MKEKRSVTDSTPGAMGGKRITATSIPVPIERHETAAWANVQDIQPVSRVTIPSETEVRNAKEWVDTNQK